MRITLCLFSENIGAFEINLFDLDSVHFLRRKTVVTTVTTYKSAFVLLCEIQYELEDALDGLVVENQLAPKYS